MFDVVVAKATSPRDGRFIEKIGTYNPNTNPATIVLDEAKAFTWVMNGAQPTDTVRAMLSYRGILLKKHLQIGVNKGAITQEEADAKFEAWKKQKESQISGKVESLAKKKEADRKARLEAEAKVKEARAEALRKKNEVVEAAEAPAEDEISEHAEETPVAEAAEAEATAETTTEAEAAAEPEAPQEASEEKKEE